MKCLSRILAVVGLASMLAFAIACDSTEPSKESVTFTAQLSPANEVREEDAIVDAGSARAFLTPLADHLGDHGVGSIAEIFDGVPPFVPNGCIAQAWSVAETLRAWHALTARLRAPTSRGPVS